MDSITSVLLDKLVSLSKRAYSALNGEGGALTRAKHTIYAKFDYEMARLESKSSLYRNIFGRTQETTNQTSSALNSSFSKFSLFISKVTAKLGELFPNLNPANYSHLAKEVIAFVLITVIVLGNLFEPIKLYAASFTITWDSADDFTNNTAGGIATTSSRTLIDESVLSSTGVVTMGPGPDGDFTDLFNDSTYIDSANTVASVTGGQVERNLQDTFTNLTSKISSFWPSTVPIYDLQYVPSRNEVYLAGWASGVGSKFAKINTLTGVATNLSSSAGVNMANALAITSGVYGGILQLGDDGSLYLYSPGSNQLFRINTSDVLSKTYTFPVTAGPGNIYYESSNDLIYIVGGYSKLYSLDPDANGGNGTFTLIYNNPTGGFSSLVNRYQSGKLDIRGYGNGGNHAYVNLSDNSSTMYGDNYGIAGNAFAYDTSRSVGYYGRASDTNFTTLFLESYSNPFNGTGQTNLTSAVRSHLGISASTHGEVGTIAYSSQADAVYFGLYLTTTSSRQLLKYYPSNGQYVTLTSAVPSGLFSAASDRITTIETAGGEMYYGSTIGGLASSTPAAASQVVQSTTIDNTANLIAYATLTAATSSVSGSGTVSFEMSNNGGSNWIPVTSGNLANFSSSGSDLRWKATLTGDAKIQDVNVTYNGYSTSTLSNLKKDAGGDAQWLTLGWNVSSLPANTTVKFRTRGATSAQGQNALYSASWSDYITAGSSGISSASITANGAGGATLPSYRYMEFEITLTSTNGIAIPAVSSLSATYAINAPPAFEADPTVSQITNSADANFGKVSIAYSIKDGDTTSGNAQTGTPGFVTPTFEYSLNNGSSWSAINSAYLASGDADNKAVQEGTYTGYTAYWDAAGQLGSQYSTTAKVRVSLNDNEIIYNTAVGTSTAFTLDTTPPSTSFNLDSSNDTIIISSTDNSQILDYYISNNSDYSDDGVNALSSGAQNGTTTALYLTNSWTPAGVDSETVYLKIRDVYGNITETTAVAPITPASIEIKDLSNPQIDSPRLFITWTLNTNQTGATFSKYEVNRSTDGVNYTATNITNQAQNYYLDTSISSTTTYYYKVRVIDSDTDSSGFTSVVSDLPDGQGGTDTASPNITSVSISNIKNTSATVTWTTDELSNSTVEYGTTNSYGSTATSDSYVLSHSVNLTGLNPDTAYYLRVKSTDIATNVGTNDNSGSSYTFTTVGGPVISNIVASNVTDNTAQIVWNTNIDSDSYVAYGTTPTLTTVTEVGSASLVGGSSPFQHVVNLSGLSSQTTYYYYVKSTDADTNTSTSSIQSFDTTFDAEAPLITDVSVPVASPTQLVVFWTTNEPATTQVDYGLATGVYTNSTTLDQTLSLTHAAPISNLTADTLYYFIAKSTDAAGNQGTSDENSTTTTSTGETIIISSGGGRASSLDETKPMIDDIQVSPGSLDAEISFTTSEPVNAFIEYGEGSDYGRSQGDPDYTSTKKIKLDGLRMGTLYHFKIKVFDRAGNMSESDDRTFKTTFLSEDLDGLQSLNSQEYQNRLEELIESALPSLVAPFIGKPQVTDVGEDSATISWRTNIKTYGSVAYADSSSFAKDSKYGTEVPSGEERKNAHEVVLTGLKPNTRYHYVARGYVFPQVVGKSDDASFITKAAKITAQIGDVTNSSFTAVWTTTEPTNSTVEYRNTATGISGRVSDEKYATIHTVLVNNLESGAPYEVKISGTTEDGNLIEVGDVFNVTTSRDVTAPELTGFKIDSALVPGRNDRIQTVISWKTNEPADSIVWYEEGSGSSEAELKNKLEDQTDTENHAVVVPNLKPATIYRIQIASTDSAGNTTKLPVRTVITPRQNESIVDVIFKNFEDTFQFLKNVR